MDADGNGCEHNGTSCLPIPSLSGDCTNLNGFPMACDAEATCTANHDGSACGTTASLVWGSACSELNGYMV